MISSISLASLSYVFSFNLSIRYTNLLYAELTLSLVLESAVIPLAFWSNISKGASGKLYLVATFFFSNCIKANTSFFTLSSFIVPATCSSFDQIAATSASFVAKDMSLFYHHHHAAYIAIYF